MQGYSCIFHLILHYLQNLAYLNFLIWIVLSLSKLTENAGTSFLRLGGVVDCLSCPSYIMHWQAPSFDASFTFVITTRCRQFSIRYQRKSGDMKSHTLLLCRALCSHTTSIISGLRYYRYATSCASVWGYVAKMQHSDLLLVWGFTLLQASAFSL